MKKALFTAFIFTAILCLLLTSCEILKEKRIIKDNTDDTSVSDSIDLTQTITVRFVNDYSVSGDSSYQAMITSTIVDAGSKLTKPEDPIREGYTFDGWYVGDTKWSFDEMTVDENTTLVAKWSPVIYVVDFLDYDGSSIDVGIAFYGGKVTMPETPTKPGCKFEGWFYGEKEWNFELDTVNSDISLTAVWSAPIDYRLDGGANSPDNVDLIYTTSSFPIKLADPIKDGHVFTGWYTDADFTNEITYITAFNPHTVYAKWEQNVIEYEVRVVSAGGMALSGITIYIHSGDGFNIVTSPKTTDTDGKVKLFLPQRSDYSVQIADAPDGYDATDGMTRNDRYDLTENTLITLTSKPIADGKHKDVYALGDVMHDFTLTDVNGDTYTLSELLETKDMVMLNFWFKSCYYCEIEFPHINNAYNNYIDDIEILAINDYDSISTIQGYPAYLGIDLKIPLIPHNSLSLSNFPSNGYPTTVIIDRYGVICAIIVGSIPYEYIWNNIFDHFTGADYEQRIITNLNEFV